MVRSSAAAPLHRVAAPMSNQARSMTAASTDGLSTAARFICSGPYPVATLAQRGKRTQRRQAQAVSWAMTKELCRGALASCCSSVEQSGQSDARRHHRWLEHGSKDHLQRILSNNVGGAARQAHVKAASTSSLMGGDCRGALASCCSSVEQSGQNDARRHHRWLEHDSKDHLQRILSGSHAGV